MVYRFTVISNEVDDFIREIKIDADATFYDFQEIILSSCGYDNSQLTSFYICNNHWEQEQEVLLEDMGLNRSDEDIYLMKGTHLSDLIEDEKQRLIFVFDPVEERMFFIELSEIIFGKPQEKPICSRQHGNAPKQYLDYEETEKSGTEKKREDLQEDFYGSDDFDSEEFDPDGFEISDGNPYS